MNWFRNRLTKTAPAVVALGIALAAVPVLAGGIWQGYGPGNPYFPQVPNGSELVPQDLMSNSASGANPQTAGFMSYQMAGVGRNNWRNVLVCGDFTACPFQRGTSQAADIAGTATYGPDQWAFKGAAGSAINWSKQTGAGDIFAGYGASVRFQRKSANADVTAICMAQVRETAESLKFQGRTAIFSTHLMSGANFSPTGGLVQLTIAFGTGTDQSLSNFIAGSWTGQTNAVQTNIPVTSTMTRYSVAGAIPATATQIGVEICWTPVGTAGTNDWVEVLGNQLEESGVTLPAAITLPPASTTSFTLSAIAQPTTFERHPLAEEKIAAQRYYYELDESAVIFVAGACKAESVTVATCYVQFPVTMRAAPTMTYANGFATETTTAGGTLGACNTLATASTVASTAPGAQGILVGCTATTVPAAGSAGMLYSNNGTGKIKAAAEL